MNLSLYLLLAPQVASENSTNEKSARINLASASPYPLRATVVFDPHQPGTAKARALHQASRCQAVSAPGVRVGVRAGLGRLGFATRVVVDAMGFLLVISGLFVALQIAQFSFG